MKPKHEDSDNFSWSGLSATVMHSLLFYTLIPKNTGLIIHSPFASANIRHNHIKRKKITASCEGDVHEKNKALLNLDICVARSRYVSKPLASIGNLIANNRVYNTA